MALLKKHGLFLKAQKCTIAAEEIRLLGHIINKDGMKTDPAKVSAIVNYPAPTNRTEVKSVMGLINFYRQYIKGCSIIAEPINRTLKKDTPFKWTDEAQKAFDKLKKILTSAPILARPNFKNPFRLHTDACKYGRGGILCQDFDTGKKDARGRPILVERVISYASASNQGAERDYSASQLEQLAVIWAVEHYRSYLEGRPFQVVTDHIALKSLVKQKDPQGQQARWNMRLLPYDIDMIYKAGRLHSAPDALSRDPSLRNITIIERLEKGPAPYQSY